uniref:Uncharacterized protein n=1 Tax=Arundo donax TaxID=35708 RepID=A0A0A8YW80_ARUDO
MSIHILSPNRNILPQYFIIQKHPIAASPYKYIYIPMTYMANECNCREGITLCWR